MYPPGTNHFNPYSPLFKDHQRNSRPALFYIDFISNVVVHAIVVRQLYYSIGYRNHGHGRLVNLHRALRRMGCCRHVLLCSVLGKHRF